ncbi:MAG: sigma-70 family RNA polymerase sigma factor [Gammaproteobacteria bacterium]|nr:MAG: sigma-70 family RNA polymerase sigma factor [Gammaproteobacteria bacterium]
MNADRDIVDAVLAGRHGAFESLVREHQGLVWHIIYRLVRDPEDARELSQETFLRVHRQLHQFRGDSALKSWIGRVAYTIGLRHLENRRGETAARVEISDDEDGANLLDALDSGTNLEAAHIDADNATHLRSAIETLPSQARMLVSLYHLEEMPIAQIAAITGLATGTIKSHLFRARLLLRRALETVTEISA